MVGWTVHAETMERVCAEPLGREYVGAVKFFVFSYLSMLSIRTMRNVGIIARAAEHLHAIRSVFFFSSLFKEGQPELAS